MDNESGTEWTTTLTALGLSSQIVGGVNADWNWYWTVARPHNVLHLQIAGGYTNAPEDEVLGQFYFGGFGNLFVGEQERQTVPRPLSIPGRSDLQHARRRLRQGHGRAQPAGPFVSQEPGWEAIS